MPGAQGFPEFTCSSLRFLNYKVSFCKTVNISVNFAFSIFPAQKTFEIVGFIWKCTLFIQNGCKNGAIYQLCRNVKKNLHQKILFVFRFLDILMPWKFTLSILKNSGVFKVAFLAQELRLVGYESCFLARKIDNAVFVFPIVAATTWKIPLLMAALMPPNNLPTLPVAVLILFVQQ